MKRGLGWRMHGSVEDTKLSTNKQHALSALRSLTHTAPSHHKLTHQNVSHPKPKTLNPKFQTLHCKPGTLTPKA